MSENKRLRKICIIISFIFVVVALSGCSLFQTEWVTIASGQHMSVIHPMRVSLDNANIRNRTRNQGSTLQVDARRAREAINIISIANFPSNDEHFTWYTIFDISLEERELFRDRASLQAAIERELINVQGITAAVVGIRLPRPTSNNEDLEHLTTVSATITTSRDFTPEEGRDLALLIAASFENFREVELENIIIIDQYFHAIWNGGELPIPCEEADFSFAPSGVYPMPEPGFSPTSESVDIVICGSVLIPEPFSGSTDSYGNPIIFAPFVPYSSLEPGIQPQNITIPGYIMPGGGIMPAEMQGVQ